MLRGTAAHNPQRLNRDEPKPRIGAAPPPYLPKTGPARATWRRLAPILTKLRVLTEADADALALACMALAEYLEASADSEGWRRADSAWKRYGYALGWLGLNPSARAKVHAAPDDAKDPTQEWLEGQA